MNITYILIAACFVSASCQNIGSKPTQQHVTSAVDSLKQPNDVDSATTDDVVNSHAKPITASEFITGSTCLTGNYRLWEPSDDPDTLLQGEWLDVYKEGRALRLAPLRYTTTVGFDECAGVKTKAISTKNNSLLLLKLADIKAGSYASIPLENNTFWPNEKLDFTCNGGRYTLTGTGNIQESYNVSDDSGKEELFHVVSDYHLTLTDPAGQVFTLVSEESFQDTFIKILFVGDLDGDNRPDFIISVPRGYEEERVLWIPSRQMNKNGLKVYEATRQFDC